EAAVAIAAALTRAGAHHPTAGIVCLRLYAFALADDHAVEYRITLVQAAVEFRAAFCRRHATTTRRSEIAEGIITGAVGNTATPGLALCRAALLATGTSAATGRAIACDIRSGAARHSGHTRHPRCSGHSGRSRCPRHS